MKNSNHDNKKPMVLILLGAPGSGKGTQAKELSKTFEIPHISTGDLFRENLSKNTALGARVKSFMESGQLVPDSLVLEMLFDRVSQNDCAKGYLLDGFPRTIPQAESLEAHLADQVNVVVVNLEVQDELIMKRIGGRLTCKQCGNIYNRYFSPPKVEGICNQCGAELIQRSDDRAEIVAERLRVYHQQTAPLVQFYDARHLLTNVNGEQQPEVVLAQIKKICLG